LKVFSRCISLPVAVLPSFDLHRTRKSPRSIDRGLISFRVRITE